MNSKLNEALETIRESITTRETVVELNTDEDRLYIMKPKLAPKIAEQVLDAVVEILKDAGIPALRYKNAGHISFKDGNLDRHFKKLEKALYPGVEVLGNYLVRWKPSFNPYPDANWDELDQED